MKLLGNFKKAALVAMMCATATGAIAATQGSLGTNSTGTFDITLNHKGNAVLWGLVDVNLTDTQPTETVSFCTFNNNTTEVSFTITSNSTDFTLIGGSRQHSNSVHYKVEQQRCN
ncbi:MAG: hypothetical protein QS721_01625 [Candidatus Endonucleobacter sp. (ex Gigantidas childressi)]|nr:hypothetical protein [Candidatus Endonucleobacter sp. (ex Gigantidas childressi)]